MTRKLRPMSAAATIAKTEWLLRFVEPLYPLDTAKMKSADVLEALRRVEAQGRLESARWLRSVCSRIFRYAVATSRAERDICADLVDAPTPPKVKHRAAVFEPEKIGDLRRSMRAYGGNLLVRDAADWIEKQLAHESNSVRSVCFATELSRAITVRPI